MVWSRAVAYNVTLLSKIVEQLYSLQYAENVQANWLEEMDTQLVIFSIQVCLLCATCSYIYSSLVHKHKPNNPTEPINTSTETTYDSFIKVLYKLVISKVSALQNQPLSA